MYHDRQSYMVFDESHNLGYNRAMLPEALSAQDILAQDARCNPRGNVDGQVSAGRTLHQVPTGPNGLTGFAISLCASVQDAINQHRSSVS